MHTLVERIIYINEAGAAKMKTLQGKPLKGLINDNMLKVYYRLQGLAVI